IDLLFAVSKEGAEDTPHAPVPRQLDKGLRIGYADELGSLRAITDIAAMAIQKQVSGCSIDQLEAALRDLLPVVGRNTLTDDAAGDRDKLVVDVVDAQFIDFGADLSDQIVTAFGPDVSFQLGHLSILSTVCSPRRRLTISSLGP